MMSHFHHKDFQGVHYPLGHLDPFCVDVPLDALATKKIEIQVTFGCHCFTEIFDEALHQDHHRYMFRGELRAFDVLRYECSLQLPAIINAIFKGRIHLADGSYTYVAHITLTRIPSSQAYSVFFSLEKDHSKAGHALKMYVKSAYLKPLVTKSNAQTWRFISLAGEVSGAFEKKKKHQPKKRPRRVLFGSISVALRGSVALANRKTHRWAARSYCTRSRNVLLRIVTLTQH